MDGNHYRRFVYIDHPRAEARLVSGFGNVQIDGRMWVATGRLAQITGTERRAETIQDEVSISIIHLGGFPQVDARTKVRGRNGSVSTGVMNQFGQLINDYHEGPLIKEFDVIFSNHSTTEDANSSALTFTGNKGLVNLGTETNTKVTTEQQKVRYPGVVDTGFSNMPGNKKRTIKWITGTRRGEPRT